MSKPRRIAIIIAVASVVLGCAVLSFAWRHFRPATLSETELWLRNPSDYTTLAATDYQVLSSFLNEQNNIRVGSGRGESILAPLTASFPSPIPGEEQRWMKRELTGLRDDTLANFHRSMRQTAVLAPRFSIPAPYIIGTFEEAENIERLYAHFPRTSGFVQFWCVGYNTDSSQALFWVERRMTHSAVGLYVLMNKDTNGRWNIAGEMVRWIA